MIQQQEKAKSDELLSIRATAQRLRRSRLTINRAVAAGEIHGVMIGKRTLVPLAEVLRILGQQERHG